MANLNKVMLIGRLTRDPELRQTTNSQVVNFGFAVNNRRKNQQTGQYEDEPVFIDCEAWDSGRDGGPQNANRIATTLSKGKQIYLEGRLKLDQWEDKNDGSKRSKLKVIVDNFQYLEPKDNGGGGYDPQDQRPQQRPQQRQPPRQQARKQDWADPQEDSNGGGDDIPF